jgi:hypothetical protein
MIESNLDFDTTPPAVSVTEMLKQFPHVSPRVLVALAFVALLERTVTPFRLCQCGCGESVHGKARLASPACRQRVSRQRRAILATSGRQFNLVIQYEIPVPIPTVPPPASESSAPIRYRGEWWYEEMKEWICEGSWPTVEEAEKEMTRRNKCFSWVPTRVRPVIYPLNGTAPIFPTEPANRASQPSQPTEPANRARAIPRTVTAPRFS